MTEFCYRCGEKLNAKRSKWLELDGTTGRFHQPGEVEPAKSQGGFPFGAACAKAQLGQDHGLARVIKHHGITKGDAEAMMRQGLAMYQAGATVYGELVR